MEPQTGSSIAPLSCIFSALLGQRTGDLQGKSAERDFMSDQLWNGKSFRTQNILDNFNREGRAIDVVFLCQQRGSCAA